MKPKHLKRFEIAKPNLYNFLCSPMSFNLRCESYWSVEMVLAPQHRELADFQNLLWLPRIKQVLEKKTEEILGKGICRTGDFSFQPSPCSQVLEAWATQGHSAQDTEGMFCVSKNVLCVKTCLTLPET